jgi:hypothetical protein
MTSSTNGGILYEEQLSESQQELVQRIVQPEADGLYELLETNLQESGLLEDLDVKEKQNTLRYIEKLLGTGIKKLQIKRLIEYMNKDKLQDIDSELPDAPDEDEASDFSIRTFGIDHQDFHWTRNLVDVIDDYSARKIQKNFRTYMAISGWRKRYGHITLKQKENDWPKLKQELMETMIEDDMTDAEKAEAKETIHEFEEHYMRASMKKKKSKKKKSKKKKSKKR